MPRKPVVIKKPADPKETERVFGITPERSKAIEEKIDRVLGSRKKRKGVGSSHG